jgi:non-heme chloroperoxidase
MKEIRIDHVRLASGVSLEVASTGPLDGPPVLMLHGITDSWRSFERVMQELPSGLRLYALSQRGHGRSERPAKGYGIADFAADAAAFIRAKGGQPMLVVGHSMGTSVALRLSQDAPELVAGLALAGTFASYADKADLRDFYRADIENLSDPVPYQLALDFQLSTLEGELPAEALDVFVRESLQLPAAVWRQAFAGLFEDGFLPATHRIPVPLQVHWADQDAFCPRADQSRVLAQADDAELIVYPGVGHALHWERPRDFAQQVAQLANVVFAGQAAGVA